MPFFNKNRETSEVVLKEFKYKKNGINKDLRDLLQKEQKSFCAYSEKFIDSFIQPEIEHYNPNYKDTSDDGYDNWFVVISRINRNKGDKYRFNKLVLLPKVNELESIQKDIEYDLEHHMFFSVTGKQEVKNLISLLRINDEPYKSDRKEKLEFLCMMRKELGNIFLDIFNDKNNLSFFSMLIKAFSGAVEKLKVKGVFPC